jgi:hypothetical protein
MLFRAIREQRFRDRTTKDEHEFWVIGTLHVSFSP